MDLTVNTPPTPKPRSPPKPILPEIPTVRVYGQFYGGRKPKNNGARKRKTVQDYAKQHPEDFIVHNFLCQGQLVDGLVCRFCAIAINIRSDRIKEHLKTQRHLLHKRLAVDKSIPFNEDLPPQTPEPEEKPEKVLNKNGYYRVVRKGRK